MEGGRWFTEKQNYFIAVSLMSSLDLPRYYMMAIDNQYACSRQTYAYGLHMLANAAFFSSYSIICSMWQNSVGSGNRITLFRKRTLAIFNVVFLLICVIAFGICLSKDTLYDFFHTRFYSFYTVVTASKNLFFFSALMWSGYEILKPLWATRQTGHRVDHEIEVRFERLMTRLEILICVVFLSGLLRFVMLCMKLAILDGGENPRWYTGPVWWTLSDFAPRLIPSVGFMTLMFGSVLVGKRTARNDQKLDIKADDMDQISFTVQPFRVVKENSWQKNNDSLVLGEEYSQIVES
eukprot:CAMPEP_0114503670 /NCGR_PEP_ID=MMETSP0109-20121206/9775_1 /TAXON_ID=29199 /ORGANISM="Chlorarachnion reptans, Strain CCCM449" /LENGTH=292 /DNA_ID=CAMNT_0001681721 /DNA_START=211 /DNA_END=1089 /DNA_ORIENTATION=+